MTIRWSAVQGVYTADVQEHWTRSQALGLKCPLDVFDHHSDDDFAAVVRFIEWAAVEWEERVLSGVALRRVAVPRPYQHAVDETRYRTLAEGIQDDRPEIVEHCVRRGPGYAHRYSSAATSRGPPWVTSASSDSRGWGICSVSSTGRPSPSTPYIVSGSAPRLGAYEGFT
jgi:hypothetical protein